MIPPPMMMRSTPLVLLALMLASPGVLAQEKGSSRGAEARKLVAHGVALMENERFEEAAAALARAGELAPADAHIP
ncbi:MAG: hypothetical protein ACYTKD_31230, partial [Planctomycetota bacterium]